MPEPAAEPFGDSCAEENTAGGRDVYGERVAAAGPKVAAVLDGIHARSPNARVFVVGYTHYIRHNGCYPRVQVWGKDANYVQAKVDQLNQVLADAAAAARCDLCGHPHPGHRPRRVQVGSVRWVEPFIPGTWPRRCTRTPVACRAWRPWWARRSADRPRAGLSAGRRLSRG